MPFYELKTETIDLKVDGSIIPQIKILTQNFTYIRRIVIGMLYSDPNFIQSEFAAGTALTNGTSIIVHESPYFDFNISSNFDLLALSEEGMIFYDDDSPNSTFLVTGVLFGPSNLYISSNESLYFIIQDDLTDAGLAITAFQVIVEGVEEITVVEKTQATNWFGWVNEVWLSITTESIWLLVIFLCVIVLPFAAWRKLR